MKSFLIAGLLPFFVSVFTCASVVASTPKNIYGLASSSAPLEHATIVVKDLRGKTVFTHPDETTEAGYFKLPVLHPGTEDVIIETKGGTLNGHPFEGTLSTRIDLAREDFAHLNPATTLVERYLEVDRGATRRQAERRVHDFLGLPDLVDFGFGVENPDLTLFHPEAFEEEASRNGGFDTYVERLVLEMEHDRKIKRSFPAPEALSAAVNDPLDDAALALLKLALNKAGSEIFNSFMEGIGFPSTESKMFAKFNEIIARIAVLEQEIKELAADVLQSEYNLRAEPLLKEYNSFNKYILEMKKLDAMKKADPTNPQITQDIKNAGKTYELAIIRQYDGPSNFLTTTYTAFTKKELNYDPIQELFARILYLKSPLITKDYFKVLEAQLQFYRCLQAEIAAMVIDAVKVDNGSRAKSIGELMNDYLVAEKIKIPESIPILNSRYVPAIKDGKLFYDQKQNLLWETHYTQLTNYESYDNHQRSSEYKAPGKDAIISMMTSGGLKGMKYVEAVKKLGFDTSDARDIKMILFNFTRVQGGHGNYTYTYYWFGNNDMGPWKPYEDGQKQFNKARSDLGMTGIWVMGTKRFE